MSTGIGLLKSPSTLTEQFMPSHSPNQWSIIGSLKDMSIGGLTGMSTDSLKDMSSLCTIGPGIGPQNLLRLLAQ